MVSRASISQQIMKPPGKKKVKKVMGEYKRKKLRSSSGKKFTNYKQASAIALSEGRRKKRRS